MLKMDGQYFWVILAVHGSIVYIPSGTLYGILSSLLRLLPSRVCFVLAKIPLAFPDGNSRLDFVHNPRA